LGIHRVTLCNKVLSDEDFKKLTIFVPGVSRTPTTDGAMWLETIHRDDREAALAAADVVSVHAPPGSLPILDAAVFRTVKPAAIVVNTSRGQNADEPAVIEALELGLKGETGGIAGYAADVIHPDAEKARKPVFSPLWEYYRAQTKDYEKRGIEDRANLILLPHLGGSTVEAFDGFCSEIIPKVLDMLGIDWSAHAAA
jgi:phosphoglycerate dehydrogenase-like enzyme